MLVDVDQPIFFARGEETRKLLRYVSVYRGVLFYGESGCGKSSLLNAGFIPAIMDTSLLDGVIQVTPDDAKEMARRAAREEGLLVGISSGATLAAIRQKLPDLGKNARVLGFNYDTGERYLSVPDFLPEEK